MPQVTQIEQIREFFEGKQLDVCVLNTKTNKLFKEREGLVEKIREYRINVFSLETHSKDIRKLCSVAKTNGADCLLVLKLKIKSNHKPMPTSEITQCVVQTRWELYKTSTKQILGSGYVMSAWAGGKENSKRLAAITGINVLFKKKMLDNVDWGKL